jgi:hypothetical protein
MNVILSHIAEIVQKWKPATARERAMGTRCRLRNVKKNVEGSTNACPCESRNECQIYKLIVERN